MIFDPPQEFTVKEPERLGLELGLLVNAADRALSSLELERAARWKVRHVRGTAADVSFPAALDELLVIDTADAAVAIVLPVIGPESAGRGVAYVRADTSNALTFETADESLINGAATLTAAAAVGRADDVICDGGAWWA